MTIPAEDLNKGAEYWKNKPRPSGTGNRAIPDIAGRDVLPDPRGQIGYRPPADEVRVVDPKTGGAKGQKLARFDLLPPDALRLVAEHYGIGAQKYEDRNWERGYSWSLSYGALQRHANAFWGDEDLDPETGSHHLAAVIFHALALLTFHIRGLGSDDRSAG